MRQICSNLAFQSEFVLFKRLSNLFSSRTATLDCLSLSLALSLALSLEMAGVLLCTLGFLLTVSCFPGFVSSQKLYSCADEQLVCQHGGFIDQSDCLYYVDCGLDPPGYPLWYSQHNCTCPSDFKGSDCSLVRPPAESGKDYCGTKGEYFDGEVINVNSSEKHMECYVDGI